MNRIHTASNKNLSRSSRQKCAGSGLPIYHKRADLPLVIFYEGAELSPYFAVVSAPGKVQLAHVTAPSLQPSAL
jgi:hypothetical protein